MEAAAAKDYKELYEASELRIIKLESELTQLKKMIFGSRQERFVPLPSAHPQLSLGIEPEPVVTSVVTTHKISIPEPALLLISSRCFIVAG